MRDVLVVASVLAFFALGALYVMACARILASSGNIDEPIDDDVAEVTPEPEPEHELVA